MAALPPLCNFGWKAPDFRLPATDGKTYSLKDIAGPKGTVVVFICNHCPYVKSVVSRLVRDANDLKAQGIGFAAICSNDAASHPEDSFENMKAFAQKHGFTFPYLHDESQKVAQGYDAMCTPDFFGFNDKLELQYRGRLDESKTTLVPNARRELYDAMTEVARSGAGPRDQIGSMGCSIKWKAA